MSKVTMPEPVACLWIKNGVVVNAFNRPPRLHDSDHRNEYFIKKGFTEEPLITTTQAEAYKDACVREALESAITVCDAAYEQGKSEYRTSCNPYFEGGCDVAESIEAKIRALIPSMTTKGE